MKQLELNLEHTLWEWLYAFRDLQGSEQWVKCNIVDRKEDRLKVELIESCSDAFQAFDIFWTHCTRVRPVQ